MTNFLYFFGVSFVFVTNIFLLYFSSENIGFGNLYLAITGLVIVFIGFIFWFLGFYSLRKSFALLPKADKLVASGVYKIVKHPIYIGIGLVFVGLSLAKGSDSSLLFTLFITIPMNYFRAKKEEEILRQKFGAKY